MHSVLENGILLGAVISWCMALAAIAQKRKHAAHYLFAALYTITGLLHLAVWNVHADRTIKHVALAAIELPFAFLLGPIIFLLSQLLMQKDFRFRWWHTLHSLPAIVAALVLIPFYALPAEELRQEFHITLTDYRGTLHQHVLIAMGISNMIYFVLSVVRTSILWSLESFRAETMVRNLLILSLGNMIVLSVVAVGLIWHRFLWVQSAMAFATVARIGAYILLQRNPATFFNLQPAVERIKYRRALPATIDIPLLQQRLLELFEKEKIYREPDLSLAKVAEMLSITPHQLSQFLNQHLGKSFAAFLNGYRVAEAKERLLQEPEVPAAAIGYQCGFNNYTTFHLVFRKFTRMAPTAFRERNTLG